MQIMLGVSQINTLPLVIVRLLETTLFLGEARNNILFLDRVESKY